jgi:hypothetical protein
MIEQPEGPPPTTAKRYGHDALPAATTGTPFDGDNILRAGDLDWGDEDEVDCVAIRLGWSAFN